MYPFKQPRITKEDLEYCKVEYFNDDKLVDVVHDQFDSLSEAINRSNKNYNYVTIFSQNTEFYSEYRVFKNKTYRRLW